MTDIKQRLQEQWNYLVKQDIAEEQILGIFVYGSQNYGYADDNSDINSKVVYIPTFEEMCLNKEWKSKEYIFGKNEEHIEVKDIREMRNMFMEQNINFIEILYTEYYILNPKYASLWQVYFVNNREVIAHYDRQKTVASIGGQLLHTLKQNPTDNKKLYNAYRLYYFLENYLNNKVYLDCLHVDQKTHDFLWNLKYGLSNFSQSENIKYRYAIELEEKTFDLIRMHSHLESPLKEDAAAALDTGVTEILRSAYAASFDEITKEDFFNSLTIGEDKAYHFIVNEIGNEGVISISQAILKSGISRPVFTSLLIKMKDQRVANIANQGTKGTYIEILQPELRAEAMKFRQPVTKIV